jgi:hypothetical protein
LLVVGQNPSTVNYQPSTNLDDPQLLFDAFLIGLVNKRRVSQSQLAFFRLFSQDVAFESVFPFDFSRARHFKAFLGAGFGFHFRHFFLDF